MPKTDLKRTSIGTGLSIRQPWAALIALGRKTIEIRTWKTSFRGPVLIHAAKLIDERPEAWQWIRTADEAALAAARGGFIASATVHDCLVYAAPDRFRDDRLRHLNDPDWFRPPVMYGFVFEEVRQMPFLPYKGQTLFFPVKGLAPR
jgi:hypothetical protein